MFINQLITGGPHIVYIYIMFIHVFGRTVELQKTAGFCDLALIRAENMDIWSLTDPAFETIVHLTGA